MPEYESSSFGEPAPWAVPASPPPPPPPAAAPLFELRPLSLGEILDRTFAIYKQRFWLYTGLASAAAACSAVLTVARLALTSGTTPFPWLAGVGAQPVAHAAAQPDLLKSMIFSILVLAGSVLYLLAYGLTQAATVAAVSAVYVGDETSIGAALKRVRKHWFRYTLILLWQGWSGIWLPLLLLFPAVGLIASGSFQAAGVLLLCLFFGSLFYAAIAVIRNSLGVVASAVEDLPVRKAMRRSKTLVAGHKARVLAIMLLVWVIGLVAGVAQTIFAVFVQFSTGVTKIVLESVLLAVTFASSAVVIPVGAIALCLFYIDERVRKEGFDLEVLLARGATPPPPAPERLPSPFTSELA